MGIMSYSPDAAISFTCSSVKFSFTCHFSFLCPVLLFCRRSVHLRHTQIKNPVHDRNSKSTSVKDGIKFTLPAVPPCFTGFLYSLPLSCSLRRNYLVFPFSSQSICRYVTAFLYSHKDTNISLAVLRVPSVAKYLNLPLLHLKYLCSLIFCKAAFFQNFWEILSSRPPRSI